LAVALVVAAGRGERLGTPVPKAFAILEGHRGRIECGSAPGGGALFTLILPVFAMERAA